MLFIMFYLPFLVVSVGFDQVTHSVNEGDVVTIVITTDHIAVEDISIILLLTPLTASGDQTVAMWSVYTYHNIIIIALI